jgi:UDP-N-acetylmuramoylalanine--D-glutamate ligase
VQSVAVIGGGESGIGAAILAKALGKEVFVSDFGTIADHYKSELIILDIPFEEGGHSIERFLSADVIVKSPGVPEKAPLLVTLREHKKRVISEIEFGHLHYDGLTIAVTGSNGKTTTAGLLYHMIKTAGKDVALGGNYGKSYARILAEDKPDVMVLEISSFQLDDIETFNPHVSILLNITPDHLDRYEYQMSKYVDSKFRITMNQGAKDFFIYNADDVEIGERMKSFSGNVQLKPIKSSDYITGITSKDDHQVFDISIQGRHNWFNARCATEACRLIGITESQIAAGLSTFVNLPHRLEKVATINGVEFINDSKATNVDSVYYALDAMTKPVVWIAGGTDKGNDYSALLPVITGRVKALICLGIDNEKLKEFFNNYISEIVETTKVSEAVDMGQKLASAGDVVLLSPACASFDLFKNYMDRGDRFREEVLKVEIRN